MNIHIKSYLFGLALCGTALTSCESFDSINLNPNDPTPETVDPTFLLTPTMIKGTLDVCTGRKLDTGFLGYALAMDRCPE